MNEENKKGSGDIQQELNDLMDEVSTEETPEEHSEGVESTETRAEADSGEPEPTEQKEEEKVTEEPKEVAKEESEQPAEVVKEDTTEPEPSKEVKDSKDASEATSKTEEPKIVGEDLSQQNQELRKQLELMARAQNQGTTPSPSPETKSAPPNSEAPKEQVKPTPQQAPSNNVIDFVDDKGFEEVVSSKDKMNQMLTKVYNMAVQNTYKNTPKMVDNMIRQRTYLNDKVDVFYKENDDLLPYRQFVGFIANEVSSQNPDWDLDKVFVTTAGQVRQRLGLKAKVIDKATQAKTKPAFAQAKKSNSRDSADKPNLSEMEEQIQDLLG